MQKGTQSQNEIYESRQELSPSKDATFLFHFGMGTIEGDARQRLRQFIKTYKLSTKYRNPKEF